MHEIASVWRFSDFRHVYLRQPLDQTFSGTPAFRHSSPSKRPFMLIVTAWQRERPWMKRFFKYTSCWCEQGHALLLNSCAMGTILGFQYFVIIVTVSCTMVAGEGQSGHYMLVDASSQLNSDTRAILTTLNQTETVSQGVCVSFWYHMFGPSIGNLGLYLIKYGKDNHEGDWFLTWSRTGSQSNQWVITTQYMA